MKTKRASKKPAFPITGTEPTTTALAAKAPDPFTWRQRALFGRISRLLTLLSALALPSAVQAQFQYTTANGKATITGYTGPGGQLIMPFTLGGFPVTGIGYRAFYLNTNLTSVILMDSVTNIGDEAFRFCSSLTNATLGNSLATIGEAAFHRCDSLTSVTIPDSVASIGSLAFTSCTNLTRVTIPDSVSSLGSSAFRNCTRLTNMTIGNSVNNIGNHLFQDCTSLTGVTIPDSVTSIGDEAFASCTGLTSVTLGKSVTNIGDYAFSFCQSLPSVTIPDSVTSIGMSAFAYCASLTSINLPADVSYIAGQAFGSCTNLRRAYFAGDALTADPDSFKSSPATLYYLPGTTGWASTFAGRPTVLWNPRILTDDGQFGVSTGRFGFTLMGAADVPVVVEACSDLVNPEWSAVTNLICNADGTAQFTDPEAADQPTRIYRFRPE